MPAPDATASTRLGFSSARMDGKRGRGERPSGPRPAQDGNSDQQKLRPMNHPMRKRLDQEKTRWVFAGAKPTTQGLKIAERSGS
jgi:hypothetical protein